MIGVIKAVRADRGYAFISAPSLNRDAFLHVSRFLSDVPFNEKLIGKELDFDAVETERGIQAENARVVME